MKKLNKYIFVSTLLTTFLVSCAAQKTKQESNFTSNETSLSFKETFKIFPREEKNLRKWDSPIFADLDQDSYSDLIINDHGFGLRIMWNNKGEFSKPFDLIMGDLHGVTVGDYDKDGLLELVISRGGGSGSNARNSMIMKAHRDRTFSNVSDFEIPLELMRGRTVQLYDGDNDGDLDLLNFAFPDKSKKGASENYIYENINGVMKLHSTLPASKINGQKSHLTDIDGDNVMDIILFGNHQVLFYQGNGDLTYTNVTDKVLSENYKHVTSVVEVDFDNDGDFDLFMTQGTEFEIGETFYDAETKDWGFYTSRGEFRFEDLVLGDVIELYNFQSQWPDNDAYYIGETGYAYEFKGETHSGKEIRLVNSDALGFPDKMTESGIYVGYVGNRSWRLAGDTWAPTTGIVSGVEKYPSYDHKSAPNAILLENVKGKFKDVSHKIGGGDFGHTTGSVVADFNNDGFQDILAIRRGDLIHDNEALLLINNQGDNFNEHILHGVITEEKGSIGMGVGVIDHDKDGDMDVVLGNERGLWHLFSNTLSDTKYLTVEVGNSAKGCSPLGAKVEVRACGLSQLQKIGTTGSYYSLSHDTFVHFGLGACEEVLAVTVTWISGESKTQQITQSNIKIGK